MDEHLRPWQPLSPEAVNSVLMDAPFPWWIAGGHAIDHFVGRNLRAHGDIDVLLLRADRQSAREWLKGWDCWAADPPGTLRPWPMGEDLPDSVGDVWCRDRGDGPWRFQLMLDNGDRSTWRSRRCAYVSKSTAELRSAGSGEIPFLTPEVQLFYKAKTRREKDEIDFAVALPLLNDSQVSWLREEIATAYGPDNPWLRKLNG